MNPGSESHASGSFGGPSNSGSSRSRSSSCSSSSYCEETVKYFTKPVLFIDLVACAGTYQNNLPYNFWPEVNPGTFNSNGYIHGILARLGISVDPPINALGWGVPIPLTYNPQYQNDPSKCVGTMNIQQAFALMSAASIATSAAAPAPEPDPAIYEAAKAGNVRDVKSILDRGEAPDSRNSIGTTPLMIASHEGHLDVVKLLIEAGADVNARDQRETSAICMAVGSFAKGREQVVKELISARANVNVKTIDGFSPLFGACLAGNLPMVKMLIKAGADINVETNNESTPLMAAVLSKNEEVVRELLKHSPKSINKRDMNGDTALGGARKLKLPNIERALIEKGAKD